MKLLLDTHVLLWTLFKPSRLSSTALSYLEDPANTAAYSLATLWEVEIKHLKNPHLMPPSARELYEICRDEGLGALSIRPNHVFALSTLKQLPGSKEHRDPFDRLLLAQAKMEGLVLLTHDGQLATYGEPLVRIV